MNEYWIAFLGSIIGGIISGGLTCLGVVLTIKHENKKRTEENKQKIVEFRPELELVSKEFKELSPKTSIHPGPFDAEVARIESFKESNNEVVYKQYPKNAKKVCITFQLKNSGKTPIEKIYICSKRPKYFVLLPKIKSDILKRDNAAWNCILIKKHIQNNSTIEVSFYSTLDDIKDYNCALIFLLDRNQRVWYQDFCIGDGNIKSSYLSKKDLLDLFTSQDGSFTAIDLIDPNCE